MNWFKRKLGAFFTSEKSESADKELEKTQYDKNIEARMIYQYPKGNFRFPLIPDEESSQNHQIHSKKQFDQAPKPKEQENLKHKKPFQPTDVPSPIYGYKKYEEGSVVEFELPINTDRVEASLPKEEEVSYFEQLVEEEIENPADNVIDSNFPIIDEKIAVEENDQNKIIDKEYDIEKNLENNRNNIQEPNKFKANEIKNSVPFNVMMLKQDKKNLQTKQKDEPRQEGSYQFPAKSLLIDPPKQQNVDQDWLYEQRQLLNQTFENFNVRAKVVNVTQGPAVTRFEVHPEPGVKVNKVTSLTDDIKLSLAAKDIRIEAPIPGKNTIGIEVPNRLSKPVFLKEIIQSQIFQSSDSPLTVALGFDIAGKPIITDLKKMPHGLIAGATGSGKSVCINAMLISLLYKASPNQVKLMLIDPKMVELAPYNDIPHLVSPVITDVKAATAALKWAVEEMERRYELFANSGARDISRYNELVKLHREQSGELPYLVIIIDELADLMMVAANDVEESICRIAQKARACGIHLILATQRPSVDVITGLIKANIPTRIAFSVSSQVDSRTIIDMNGAERLLGKGDMLFLDSGTSKPIRVQGNFVSDDEIERIVDQVKSAMETNYLFEQQDLIKKGSVHADEDELFYEACEFIINQGGASTSSLQRNFRIGYNRAARLIDMMAEQGIISEARGTKPRDVLISEEELATIQTSGVVD